MIYQQLSFQKGTRDFSGDNRTVGGLFWLIGNDQLKFTERNHARCDIPGFSFHILKAFLKFSSISSIIS